MANYKIDNWDVRAPHIITSDIAKNPVSVSRNQWTAVELATSMGYLNQQPLTDQDDSYQTRKLDELLEITYCGNKQ